MADNNWSDGSFGTLNGNHMYYDQVPDGMHIFPGGLPRGHHSDFPHDHIFVNNDGGVEYMREGNQLANNYRNWQGNG